MPKDNDTHLTLVKNDCKVMSHIEIANIAGKRSDNVKRTADRLVEEGVIASPQIEGRHKQRVSGQLVQHYMLNRLDSITLMATVDSRYCAQLVRRWDALESGNAKPTYQAEPALEVTERLTSEELTQKEQISIASDSLALAQAYGFEGNQALIAADNLSRSLTNFSPLESMGQKALVSPVKELTFTPTELGRMMTPPLNPRDVNLRLEVAGMQCSINRAWEPTAKGQSFCEVFDVQKAHSDGTPVKQVKWFKRVLDELTVVPAKPVAVSEPVFKPVTREAIERYFAPVVIQNGTKRQPNLKRKRLRSVGRYNLKNALSIREIAETFSVTYSFVRDLLIKNHIIKKVALYNGTATKYVLTNKGWKLGKMYDPTRRNYHGKDSDQIMTSNAQVIFFYGAIDYLIKPFLLRKFD